MKLQTAIIEFLLAGETDNMSSSTLAWYRSLLSAFSTPRPDARLEDISAHEIRSYLVALRRTKYSESTIQAHNRALHRFFSWASREFRIDDPMRNIAYPTAPQPQPRAVDLGDLAAMIEAAGDGVPGARNRAMLYMLIDTGIRAAGLTGLTMSDVDLERRRLIVTEKGGKSRGVVYASPTALVLEAWIDVRQDVPPVFYNLDTLKPLTPNGLYQALRRIARRAGVQGRFNPHGLRHAFAREYIRNGGDLATLSRLLGHRDVSTTVNHYTIFTDSELQEAHEKYSPVKNLKSGLSG